MSSLLKIQSARANGARSRGPVTPEGLARSSQNALKHGLTSRSIVLSNESESDFEQLHESYLAQFNPQTDVEVGLVEQLVASRWRIERIWALETALLDLEMLEQEDAVKRKYEAIEDVARTALAFRALCDGSRSLEMLSRYEARHRRASDRILNSLLRLQELRLANERLPNEPNHPTTRVSAEEPQHPENFTPAGSTPPDPDDLGASTYLIPLGSMNAPSLTSSSAVSPSRCRTGVSCGGFQ
jgi:hypothetical protein